MQECILDVAVDHEVIHEEETVSFRVRGKPRSDDDVGGATEQESEGELIVKLALDLLVRGGGRVHELDDDGRVLEMTVDF